MRCLVRLSICLLLLAGCSTLAGPSGEYHGSFKCKGKGVITGTGHAGMAVMLGGGGQNAFTLTFDCGEGLEVTRERARSDTAESKP